MTLLVARCPDCSAEVEVGATRCAECAGALNLAALLGGTRNPSPSRGGVSPSSIPAGQPALSSFGLHGQHRVARSAEQDAWACPNCLREWPEPSCDECGANLIGGRR